MEAVVLVLLGLLHVAAADDIVGCGGFVEASQVLRKPSDPKLDYSGITVKLRTLEGLVKDHTQCAPNGYYFLPVYEKGSFVLQVEGPVGWSFAPDEVRVAVDQAGCNNNEDVDFQITGFMLSGKVTGAAGRSCKKVGDGPSGVTISLFGPGRDHASASVVTGPGGTFRFKNNLPGKYRLEAAHPSFDVVPRGLQEVEVKWGNAEFNDLFTVPGYDVEGYVLSKGNPVLGVQVFLHSNDVSEILCPQGSGKSPLPGRALCHSVSDANGRFKFLNVPCGDYTLVPYYKGETTVFDVSPAVIEISVGHGSVVVEQAFQVTGFSVGGRVTNGNGEGVENVKIFLDNVERAVTDSNGFYKLDQVTSATYTVTAAKEHYRFSSLDGFMVLPNMASLPSLVSTHYSLCGTVRVLGQYGRRQVALTHGSVKAQHKRVSDSGEFCFEVPPGEYRLSPTATAAEQEAGLLFVPEFLDLEVTRPVPGIVFSQAQVSISGSVKCLEGCGSHVTIALSSLRGERTQMQVAQLDKDEKFHFDKVLPGKYELEVTSASEAAAEDDWCWEQKNIVVQVFRNDVDGVLFTQKGYWLRIEATHSASALTMQNGRDSVPLQITKGRQEMCIESPGVHELHFIRPCVFFGRSQYSFDTSNPKPIYLRGEKYALEGHILVDSRSHDAKKLEGSLFAQISGKTDGSLIDNVSARLVEDASDTSPTVLYEYEHWAQLGDELVLSPRYKSDESESPVLLFYPRRQHVSVAVDDCQPKVPPFAGRPGVYIKGSVVPALEGVEITVSSVEESKVGQLQPGEVATRVATGADGIFVAGPLYDDAGYEVQAKKVGYHIKSLGNYTFQCQKLSQIAVSVLPGHGAEDIMPSILLSLSGDDGYRKNAVASQGNIFVFENLFPGSFYLRPLLKEYTFNPPAQALELEQGQSLSVSFTADRSAYSVYGTIASLSGKPAGGVSIEARSETGNHYEETVSDVDGRYRLRGLLLGRRYTVGVVTKDLERASPRNHVVKVAQNDTRGVDFVVFEHSPLSTLSGVVEGNDLERWQPQLAVRVASAKLEKEVRLSPSFYFQLQGLPKGKYLVTVISKDVSTTHKLETSTVEVDLVNNNHVHLASLNASVVERRRKQDLAPAPVVPVVVGILVIALLAAMPSLKEASSIGQKKDLRKANPTRRVRTY